MLEVFLQPLSQRIRNIRDVILTSQLRHGDVSFLPYSYRCRWCTTRHVGSIRHVSV